MFIYALAGAYISILNILYAVVIYKAYLARGLVNSIHTHKYNTG